MEVTPGYKQTDVGVIPEEWDVCRLDSLGAGSIPPIKAGPFGSSLTKDIYVPSGYKVYGQEQVIRGDYHYGDYFVTLRKYRELESCAVRPGDVLMSLVGTLGRLLAIPDEAPLGIINPRLIRFSLNKNRICPHYFKFLFESQHVQEVLERQSQGGTMGVLNAGLLRPFCIPVPPLPEQRAIATALSDVDGLLDGLDRLIAKKRDLKEAAMQQLLTGQTRLPGFTGEWDVKSLGELTTLLTNGFVGTATNAYVEDDDGVLYIQGYNIQVNGFNFHGIKRVSKAFHIRHPKSCLQAGDLLTIQTGAIGVTAVVPAELTGTNCHALVISRFNKRWSDPKFYSQYFNSERGRAAFKEIETGTTMKHLNCGDMKELMMPAPSLAEQTAIASVLSDMDSELSALEQRLAKTRALKQGMMQELLTGRTRLV